MARLGRGVHQGVGAHLSHHVQNGGPVPNIDGMVMKVFEPALEAFGVPGDVALGAEENRPHVIIDPVDLPLVTGKKGNDLAAD